MEPTPQFRTDLYQGTPEYYDRYRVPYPVSLLDDLVARAGVTGSGRLLDIACGPGRVTFALAKHFAEVVAVDQEEECVSYARSLAAQRGATHIQWRAGRAEDLEVESKFELVTIGDAFHRLDRRRVAALAMDWLHPGGKLAILWSSVPWAGPAPWQDAGAELVQHWIHAAGSAGNIPSNLAESMTELPNTTVLADAGFEVLGTYEFHAPYVWTLDSLAGFSYSTSILSRPMLGNHIEAFERDLQDRLLAIHPDGKFEEDAWFKYELAARP